MTSTDGSPTYNQMLEWARQFSAKYQSSSVDGEYYDMPGTTVYTTTKLPVPSGGRLEVNLANDTVESSFSWKAEITIDDLEKGIYQHILLQTDGQVVETYGKQVIPADEASSKKIYKRLQDTETKALAD